MRDSVRLAKEQAAVLGGSGEPLWAGAHPAGSCCAGKWSEERYRQIEGQIGPFLKACGYHPKKDVHFVPVSGMSGANIKDPVPSSVCTWWKGGTLFSILDQLSAQERDPFKPIRLPVLDRFKDMGLMVLGKLEQGVLRVGDHLAVQPSSKLIKVTQLFRDETDVKAVRPGENCRLKVTGVEEDDLQAGFVLSSPNALAPVCTMFEAQLKVLDLLEHKSIFSSGYQCVLHLHAAVEECEVDRIVAEIDPKTKEKKKARYVRSQALVVARIRMSQSTAVETFAALPQMGRFTLRDEGRTIAIGKVTRVPKAAA